MFPKNWVQSAALEADQLRRCVERSKFPVSSIRLRECTELGRANDVQQIAGGAWGKGCKSAETGERITGTRHCRELRFPNPGLDRCRPVHRKEKQIQSDIRWQSAGQMETVLPA